MRLRWILPFLALLCLAGLLWMALPGQETSPQARLERARALLSATPPDGQGALGEIEEALRQARGPEWGVLRAAALRERAKLYAGRGLSDLALADCRTALEESGPHADTLALAADVCLTLGEAGTALEYAEELAALAPARGQGRIGRACLALADAPLAAIERLARSSLPKPSSASAITLAQRAATFVDEPSVSTIALQDLLERFPRDEDRRRVGEWVSEASEHLGRASSSFSASLEGAASDAVAGLQDLLLRAGAAREAIDLGRVALAVPNLQDPMPVLARTALALADLGRLETARALILDQRQRSGAALRPQQLTSFEVENQLLEWCFLLERLSLWDELRLAVSELFARGRDDDELAQYASFFQAAIELAQGHFDFADNWLAAVSANPSGEHDIGVRVWLARAAVARGQAQRAQERFALLMATKAAPADPREEPLRADIGRAWQRLYELQRDEGDLLAAEVSLTNALRCSAARGAELEPLWNELGNTPAVGRGNSSPYLVYARAKGSVERGAPAAALEDVRALLDDYPGLGPALELESRVAFQLHDYPLLIASSLELLERGWPGGGPSARLRMVPKQYFLPQDRVRWLEVDPRGSLEDVLRSLLARGDVQGASLAARGGPARYQRPELLPLLARVELDSGEVSTALQTLDLLPVDSAPFRGCTALALRCGLARFLESGQTEALGNNLAKVISSGKPEDDGLPGMCDALLGLGRLDEARALLPWMAEGPFLAEWLLRAAAARAVAGEGAAEDDDLERAASLLDDGRPELGRLVLASARDDAASLAREARAALDSPLAAARVHRAALLALAGDTEAAAALLAENPLDGRDALAEFVAASLAVLAPPAASDAPPASEPVFTAFVRASVPPARALVLALASDSAPWSAWTLAQLRALSAPLQEEPATRALRARSLLTLQLPALALAALGPSGSSAPLEWLRAEGERARGTSPEAVHAAEIAWFAASGLAPGEDPALLLLAAERRLADGDRAGGQQTLEAALAAHPDDAGLLARLAALEDTPGRRTRAIELYTRLLAVLPQRSDEPAVPRFLAVLDAARDGGEISESRWWSEVEALEAERASDPAPARELAERAFERPLGAADQARTHALQRLERFRSRTFARALEPLRAGEVRRWTDLLARFSPERALDFAEGELLHDPADPELWRATVRARLAAGLATPALERLTALQHVAPERETGRLLVVASYRLERDPVKFAVHLADIERYDTHAREDPEIAFYADLAAAKLGRKAPPTGGKGKAGEKKKQAKGAKARGDDATPSDAPGAAQRSDAADGEPRSDADAAKKNHDDASSDEATAASAGEGGDASATQTPDAPAPAGAAAPQEGGQRDAQDDGGAPVDGPKAPPAAPDAGAAPAKPAVSPGSLACEHALGLWKARDENGLSDSEHGRALALALFEDGRRESALEVLVDTRTLAHGRLERNLLDALAFLIRNTPAAPRRLVDSPLPPRLEESVFSGPAGGRKPGAAPAGGKAAGAKPGAGQPGAAPAAGGKRAGGKKAGAAKPSDTSDQAGATETPAAPPAAAEGASGAPGPKGPKGGRGAKGAAGTNPEAKPTEPGGAAPKRKKKP